MNVENTLKNYNGDVLVPYSFYSWIIDEGMPFVEELRELRKKLTENMDGV